MVKAAQKNQPEGINIDLLPQKELGGTLGSTVHWVLTVGRYLIILTEIIALATFGLSLKLTVDKNNLNKKVQEQQAVIDSQSDFETEFREVQSKLDNIKKIRSQHFSNNKAIDEFVKLLPKGLSLTTLSIEGKELKFSGKFPTAAQLHTLIKSFNESDKITQLSIDDLKTPSVKEPKFTIDATATINTSGFTENKASENSPTEET